MAETQWKKIPEEVKGELRWNNGRGWHDVYAEVLFNTMVLYPRGTTDRNQILRRISFTQITEISEVDVNLFNPAKYFKLSLRNGQAERFQCSSKGKHGLQKWIKNLTHAKKFWDDKKIIDEGTTTTSTKPKKVILVGKQNKASKSFDPDKAIKFFTLWNGQVVGLPVKDTSTFADVYPGLFSSACTQGACRTCELRYQSSRLWAVNTSGKGCQIGKESILVRLDPGDRLFVTEHHQKLLIVYFSDVSYEVIPAPTTITAEEVLHLDPIAAKLVSLKCINPGLFLRNQDGTELLFEKNDKPFKFQHGTFVAKSKAVRTNSKKRTEQLISELRRKAFVEHVRRQRITTTLQASLANQIEKSTNMDEELCFVDNHFALENVTTPSVTTQSKPVPSQAHQSHCRKVSGKPELSESLPDNGGHDRGNYIESRPKSHSTTCIPYNPKTSLQCSPGRLEKFENIEFPCIDDEITTSPHSSRQCPDIVEPEDQTTVSNNFIGSGNSPYSFDHLRDLDYEVVTSTSSNLTGPSLHPSVGDSLPTATKMQTTKATDNVRKIATNSDSFMQPLEYKTGRHLAQSEFLGVAETDNDLITQATITLSGQSYDEFQTADTKIQPYDDSKFDLGENEHENITSADLLPDKPKTPCCQVDKAVPPWSDVDVTASPCSSPSDPSGNNQKPECCKALPHDTDISLQFDSGKFDSGTAAHCKNNYFLSSEKSSYGTSSISRSSSDSSTFRKEREQAKHKVFAHSSGLSCKRLLSVSEPDLGCAFASACRDRSLTSSNPNLIQCPTVRDVYDSKESSEDSDVEDVAINSDFPQTVSPYTNTLTRSSGPAWIIAKKIETTVGRILAAKDCLPEVDRLIAGELCPSLREILENGLKKRSFWSLISKGVNVWDICRMVSAHVGEPITSRFNRGNISDKFMQFIRECIRKKCLSRWFETLSDENVQMQISKYYEGSAIVSQQQDTKAMEHLKVYLDKLDVLTLNKMEYERRDQNEGPLISIE